MGAKELVKAHVDEFKAKKKILKEGKTNYKDLGLGLVQILWGVIFFIVFIDNIYFKIGAKILAVVLLANGVGFILKSRNLDEKVKAHVVQHKKKVWDKD